MIGSSFSGLAVHGDLFYPRIGLLIVDQPEERAIMCLKRRDSFMDCSLCTLPSRLHTANNQSANDSSLFSPSIIFTSEDDLPGVVNSSSSTSNITDQVSEHVHPPLDVPASIQHQLNVARQNISNQLPSSALSASRWFLLSHSAHDIPPALVCFAGLGPAPHHIYNMITFDRVHVLDLGLTRHLCDITNTVIQKTPCCLYIG